MRGRGGILILALALLAPALAGCIGALQDDPASQAVPEDKLEAATEPGYQPNRFLLDDPRPTSVAVSSGAEPMILASDSGDLFIGDTAGVHRSQDQGATWDTLPTIISGTCDGVDVDEDATGRLYAVSTACAAIQMARSEDGGDSWEVIQPVADAAPIADRPWIAAHGDGQVASVFYDFGRSFSETCMVSTDAGTTFADRATFRAPPNAGGLVYDDLGIHYGQGRSIYTFADASCLGLVESTQMVNERGPQIFTPVDSDGTAIYTALPTGNSTGLQIAGTQDHDTVRRMTLFPSDPSGSTQLVTNTFLTVSAQAGQVAVAWYGSETSGDPSQPSFEGSWNVFVAIIDGFWTEDPTVTYHRLTDEPNHVGDLCMGGSGCGGESDRDLLDYFGVDHGPDGGVHVAYGHDGTTTDAQVRYACVGEGCPENLAPQVEAEVLCLDLTCVLDATGTTDPDGDTLTYTWDTGDGDQETGQSTQHTYAEAGTYEVTLTVDDGTTTVQETLQAFAFPAAEMTITPAKPVFDIDEPIELTVNLTTEGSNDGLAGVPISLTTFYQTGQANVDTLFSSPGATFALTSADTLYHRIEATTGPDGNVTVTVPSEAQGTGQDANAPSGLGQWHVRGQVDLEDVFTSGRATYQVGPSP